MGFYGAGCPYPGVETLAAQVNKLLIHFGCQYCLGVKLQLAVEMVILDLDMFLQSLQKSYRKYSARATSGWLKLLWEKVDMLI